MGITGYVLKRLISLAITLLGVSVIVFLLVHLSPGDPIRIMLGEQARPEDVQRLTELYGFDEPLPVQYVRWMAAAVQGDLGDSIRSGTPVIELVAQRLPATIELAVVALILAVVIGIPLGVLAAVTRNSPIDLASMGLALVGVAAPNFWIGLILLSTVASNVGWIPAFGRGPGVVEAFGAGLTEFRWGPLLDAGRHLLLPSLAIGTSIMAIITRMTRSSLLEVLGLDYVRTARAKGVRRAVVTVRHALRNAILPVVTVVGLQFGFLLGGAIVTETVFAWPGIGRLIVDSIAQRDFPVVQGSILMLAVVFVFVNLLVDLSYGLINPRIRYD